MKNTKNIDAPSSKAILEFIVANNKVNLKDILNHFGIALEFKHFVRRKLKKLIKNKEVFKLGKFYHVNDLAFNITKTLPKNIKVTVLLNNKGQHYCKIASKKAAKIFKNTHIEIENYSKDYLNKDIVVKITKVTNNKVFVLAPCVKNALDFAKSNSNKATSSNIKTQAVTTSVEDINNKLIILGQVTSIENSQQALVKSITFGVRKSFTVNSIPEYVKKGDIIKFTNPLNQEGYISKQANFLQLVHEENELLSLSMLSLKELNIPLDFPQEVLKEVEGFKEEDITLSKGRKDLTNIHFVTIDGDDSKDFDDAVYCKPYINKKQETCYHIMVAIADVASYVKENSFLDKDALLRANSVYLPNMVVPMLPPLLSNNLCSLVPNKKRKAVVAHIYINGKGSILKYEFENALILSHARLTYNNVQNYIDEKNQTNLDTEIKEVINNLYSCFKVLNNKSIARGALKIDLPETKIVMDENENIKAIKRVYSQTSNKIIEEFMVLANVCCALFIKEHGFAKNAVFRIHEKPDFNKIMQLKESLKHFKYNLDIKRKVNGSFFNKIIDDFKNNFNKDLVYKSILQTQSQAKYSNENIGHFGLALEDYCHFTSPIRRYSDLIAHRIIKNILAKKDFVENTTINDIAKDISLKERRATNAELNSIDRIIAKYFEDKMAKDEVYEAKITSITKSGIFIQLTKLYARGLIPMRFMNFDNFVFDSRRNALKGARSKKIYSLGDSIEVKISEVDVLRGLIAFYPIVDISLFKSHKPFKHPRKKNTFTGKKTKTKRR